MRCSSAYTRARSTRPTGTSCEATRRNVTTVQPGDEVFGSPFGHGQGALAEFCAFASEDLLEPKPANLSFERGRALTRHGTLVLGSGESDGRWIGPLGRIVKGLLPS